MGHSRGRWVPIRAIMFVVQSITTTTTGQAFISELRSSTHPRAACCDSTSEISTTQKDDAVLLLLPWTLTEKERGTSEGGRTNKEL